MILPNVGRNYAQERKGIAAVQSYAASNSQIWRETGTGDIGIDGQIEFVNEEGFATGQIIAVQVKAGTSYFQYSTGDSWRFYPDTKHRNYWEKFPIPVLLILHNTDDNNSYWVDARQSLRKPTRIESSFIEIPKKNILQTSTPIDIFQHAGVINQGFISDINTILETLVSFKSKNGSFPLSYFDMFTQGLTSISRSIYFGMDLIINAVEYNLEANNSEFGMGMGADEYEFVFGFVQFLVAQNLAQIDYADCLIDWVDREMTPHFIAPLTSRGRSLVKLIHEKEKEMVLAGLISDAGYLHVAQEGFFEMVLLSYFNRLPRIRHFQNTLEKLKSSASNDS